MRSILISLFIAFVCVPTFLSAEFSAGSKMYLALADEKLTETDWNKAVAAYFFTKNYDSIHSSQKIGFEPENFGLSLRADKLFWNTMSQELSFRGLKRCSTERRVWLYESIYFLRTRKIVDIDEAYSGKGVTIFDLAEVINRLADDESFPFKIKFIGEIDVAIEEIITFRASDWSMFQIIDETCSMSFLPPNVYFEDSFLIIEGVFERKVTPSVPPLDDDSWSFDL